MDIVYDAIQSAYGKRPESLAEAINTIELLHAENNELPISILDINKLLFLHLKEQFGGHTSAIGNTYVYHNSQLGFEVSNLDVLSGAYMTDTSLAKDASWSDIDYFLDAFHKCSDILNKKRILI